VCDANVDVEASVFQGMGMILESTKIKKGKYRKSYNEMVLMAFWLLLLHQPLVLPNPLVS